MDTIGPMTSTAVVCLQCGACSASCPSRLRPFLLIQGRGNPTVDIWACTTCYKCVEVCPCRVDLVSIVRAMRAEAGPIEQHMRPLKNLLTYGHANPLTEDMAQYRTQLGLPSRPSSAQFDERALAEVRKILKQTRISSLIGEE